MTNFIITYFVIANILGFAVCGMDKYFARNDMFRVPEKVLLTLCFIGGAAGFYLGMHAFRHKTKKNKFRFGVPLIIILWITALMLIRRVI